MENYLKSIMEKFLDYKETQNQFNGVDNVSYI